MKLHVHDDELRNRPEGVFTSARRGRLVVSYLADHLEPGQVRQRIDGELRVVETLMPRPGETVFKADNRGNLEKAANHLIAEWKMRNQHRRRPRGDLYLYPCESTAKARAAFRGKVGKE